MSPCDEKHVDVAWNNAFRKIFNAYWHESVVQTAVVLLLLSSCVHLVTHEEIVILEENAMLYSANLILCRLAKCSDASMFALAAKYHIEPHDAVRSSVARIKDSFWFYFSEFV